MNRFHEPPPGGADVAVRRQRPDPDESVVGGARVTDIVGVIYGWSGYDEVGNPTYWRITVCAD